MTTPDQLPRACELCRSLTGHTALCPTRLAEVMETTWADFDALSTGDLMLLREAEASVALDRNDEIGTYTLDEIGNDHDDA